MSQMPEAPSLQSQAQPSSRPAAGRATKVDPLARRRLLLSGLGKGAAVVAAAVPIQTLASSVLVCNGSSGKNGLCTVSGFQSAMHSFGGSNGPTQVPARGGNWVYWGRQDNSTPPKPMYPYPVPYTTLYRSIFGGTSTLNLFQAATTNDMFMRHWAIAYLNAAKFYPTSFPYPAETTGGVKGVRDWFSDPQSVQALELFTKLEVLYS